MTETVSPILELPLHDRAKNFFDLAALKRRFGPPPLYGQSETSFDELMLDLASQLKEGDSIIAASLYQYGLEQFKMMALMRWQSEVITKKTILARKQDGIERGLRYEFRTRREMAGENQELLDSCTDEQSTRREISNAFLWRRTEPGAEIFFAREFESILDDYVHIDRFINECSKRAADALRRVRSHSVILAERLENEFMDAAAEAQYARLDHLD